MTRRATRSGLVLAIAAGWLLVAGTAIAADTSVEMQDFTFSAKKVTIREGDTVTWTNVGQAPHDAAGDGWSTELLVNGGSDSVRFGKAGTYRYLCTIHPEMTGTVVVEARGGGGNGGDDGTPPPTQPPTDTAITTGGEAPGTPDAGGLPGAAVALGMAALGGLLVAGRRFARVRAG
jgi:plastocyanin